MNCKDCKYKTAQEQAEGMLPEKRDASEDKLKSEIYYEKSPRVAQVCYQQYGEELGFNEMHSIAQNVLAKYLLKIKELEKCLLEYSQEKK